MIWCRPRNIQFSNIAESIFFSSSPDLRLSNYSQASFISHGGQMRKRRIWRTSLSPIWTHSVKMPGSQLRSFWIRKFELYKYWGCFWQKQNFKVIGAQSIIVIYSWFFLWMISTVSKHKKWQIRGWYRSMQKPKSKSEQNTFIRKFLPAR